MRAMAQYSVHESKTNKLLLKHEKGTDKKKRVRALAALEVDEGSLSRLRESMNSCDSLV